MNLAHFIENQVLIIQPELESIDAKYAPLFKENVIQLIENEKTKNVICDLKHIEFIDSSGLGAFLSILRALDQNGGDLKLSCLKKQVRTLFELVRMHKIFEIYNTNEDALHSFN